MRVIAPSADIKIPLRSGAKLNIVGEKGDWLKIKHNGSEVWVHSKYVKKGNNPSSSNSSNESNIQ